eukprot:TRINITY_DN57905_c0_g1_i1.p1 TRINITY_DN57905_c0_g1~~TRINITY_DN57905_c0_g1_i1.p1  ORF type:complete len:243 (+),score=57.01 TRINITY_DN57905_c0_g1_i1:56-784(+)
MSGKGASDKPSPWMPPGQEQANPEVEAGKAKYMEHLNSARKAIAESDQITDRTLVVLDGQTQQLMRIEDDCQSIQSNLSTSKRLLKGLKPFGWLKGIFRKSEPPKAQFSQSSTLLHASSIASSASNGYPAASAAASSGSPNGVPTQGGGRGAARLIAQENERRKIQAEASKASSSRPDMHKTEVDEAFDDMDRMLEGLKHKTKAIGAVIEDHNKVIPEIGKAMARDQQEMKDQRKTMAKILK